MKQTVFTEKSIAECLTEILADKPVTKLLVVCGGPCLELDIVREVKELPLEVIWFEEFEPNPDYESVVKGVKVLKENACDAVLAIGGGSAMDVAKCIKLYATMDDSVNYLKQQPEENGITLLAVPTTAGTGSEATRFAVIYYQGEKQSVAHTSIIPEYVFLYPEILKGLPEYQKKATAMDALCHAIEAYWSVNSTEESKEYSEKAISLVMENLFPYLDGDMEAAGKMLLAANVAGRAINITQTTAGHAMCYKLTSLYGIAHGHAAALCVDRLWPYMLAHQEDCLDARGKEYLEQTFGGLASAFGCKFAGEAAEQFHGMLEKMGLFVLEEKAAGPLEEQLEKLVPSVNLTRLKNNPVRLGEKALKQLYTEILGKSNE